MVRFTREHPATELTLLRRRVELLERQVEALARFTGIDPHHLPAPVDPVGGRARELVARGRIVQAVRAHREDAGVDLVTARRDIDAVARGRL